jgi:hypothetical protein
MTRTGAAKGHAGRAKWKSVLVQRTPALLRAAKAARAGVIGLLFPSLMSSPDDLDRWLPRLSRRQALCGPAARAGSHAKWRWDRLREPGKPGSGGAIRG